MNYKININRQKLSEKEIQSKMNFSEFMQGYQAAGTVSGSFLNGIKYLSIVGASGIVLLGGYFAYKGFFGTASDNAAAPFVDPPIAGAGVPLSAFSIDTKRDTAVVYNTGSSIIVPAKAFLDEKGKPVEGKVELRYREFHDPFEVMLSGIPMHYDSAGERYQFESAGMVEVLAFKDGQPLYTNPDAPIKINMLSRNTDDKFNVYYLDTVGRKWDYLGKNCQANGGNKPMLNEQIAQRYLQEAIKQVEQQMPQQAKAGLQHFTIDYNSNEFPELASFSNVQFEVDPKDKDYHPGYASITWSDVNISKHGDGKRYTVQFSNETESHSFTVTPVLEGKDYEKAETELEMKMLDYTIALRDKKVSKKQQEDILLANYQQLTTKAEWDDINTNVRKELAKDPVNYFNLTASAFGLRTFTVNTFGTINMDFPHPCGPEYDEFMASFTDSKSSPLKVNRVYVCEKSRNVLFPQGLAAASVIPNFRCNPGAENLMVAVTPEGLAAYIGIEEFRKAVSGKGEAVFKMKVIEKKIKDPAELRALFKI